MGNTKYLTEDEAIAYAVIALHTLESSANNIDPLLLAKEIPVIMRLHTKEKALERANKILGCKIEEILHSFTN